MILRMIHDGSHGECVIDCIEWIWNTDPEQWTRIFAYSISDSSFETVDIMHDMKYIEEYVYLKLS